MIRLLLAAGAACLALPAAAQPAAPSMTLEQQMLLRCSAAFAIVAGEQQRGLPAAREYPPLAARGREFFVRAGARLMDELKLSREQVQARLLREADALQPAESAGPDGRGRLAGVMGPCLQALEASGI